MRGKLRVTAIALCLVLVGFARVYDVIGAQERPFYEGKSLRLVLFGQPGGGNDLWARLLARYIAKHIPGRPKVIVQNMPGAAGMIATNYLWELAKRDGLTIGLISPALYMPQVMGKKEVRFDWTRFGWLGTPEVSPYQIYVRTDAGYENFEDVRKASAPIPCATSGIGSLNYALLNLTNEVLGAKFKPILGYTGSASMSMAVQRGEVVCRATTISTHLTREPTKTWHKTGFSRVLLQTGRARHPELADAPTIWELADRYVIPKEDRDFIELVLAADEFGRPFITPPGIPHDRLRILRNAFDKTMADPEFLHATRKAGLEVQPKTGAELEVLAGKVIAIPPNLKQRLGSILSSK